MGVAEDLTGGGAGATAAVGKLRGICVPGIIFRIVGALLCKYNHKDLEAAMGAHQLCLAREAIANACLAIQLRLSQWTPGDPLIGVGKGDFNNGYGKCNRGAGITFLFHNGAKAVVPLLRSLYCSSQAPKAVFHDAAGKPILFECTTGVLQGDSLSPVVFGAAGRRAADDVEARNPDATIGSFVDDTFFAGPPATVANVFTTIKDPEGLYAREANLTLAEGKSAVWFPAALTLEQQRLFTPDITIAHPNEGILILGLPIGHPDWVREQLRVMAAEKAKPLSEPLLGAVSEQNQAHLVRTAISTRLNHYARYFPTPVVGDTLSTWDGSIKSFVARQLGEEPDTIPADAWQLATLPMSMGGLGFTSLTVVKDAAFLAAWLQAIDLVVGRWPHLLGAAKAVSYAAAEAGAVPVDGVWAPPVGQQQQPQASQQPASPSQPLSPSSLAIAQELPGSLSASPLGTQPPPASSTPAPALPGSPVITAAQLAWGEQLAAAWGRVVGMAAANDKVLAKLTGDAGLGRLFADGTQGYAKDVQRTLSRNIHSALVRELQNRGSWTERVQLLSQRARSASSWLRALRNNPANVFRDAEYRVALRLWLRLPQTVLRAAGGSCPVPASTDGSARGGAKVGEACKGNLDAHGRHLVDGQCTRGDKSKGAGRTARHDALTRAITTAVVKGLGGSCTIRRSREALAGYMKESFGVPPANTFFPNGKALRVHKEPDAIITFAGRPNPIVLDTCIGGFDQQTAHARALLEQGFVADLKEQNKHNQYQSALKAVPHPLSPTDLVCFAWDRACCASKGARAFIDTVAGAIATRVGDKAAGKVTEIEMEEAARVRAAEVGQLVRGAGQKAWTKRYRTRKARTVECLMQICTATIMRGHATSILHAAECAERARTGAGEGGRVQAAWERAVGGEAWGFADAELIGMAAAGAEAIGSCS